MIEYRTPRADITIEPTTIDLPNEYVAIATDDTWEEAIKWVKEHKDEMNSDYLYIKDLRMTREEALQELVDEA